MTEKTFLSKDGKSTVHYYVWEPEGDPVAILQITHGMAEHLLRYEGFAEYLNGFGILVCGNDHIGHGRSSAPEDWGYFGENEGWKIFVQDVEQLHEIMKVQYMDIPYFLMGHSMGSFVARAWLAMYGNGVDGAVIMGTAGTNPALGIAKFLVKTIRKFKGSRHISKLLTVLAFGGFNKRIKPGRTDFDWLTRDNAIVDKYIDDPACGFTFTTAGYADLFGLIGYISSDNCYKLIPKPLPILLVAGAEDPVGSYGDGPAEVAEKLETAGCTDVSLILYEGMRHEILNEIGKETVMDDIRRFILGEEAPGEENGEPEEEAEAGDAAAPEDAIKKAIEEEHKETISEEEATVAEVDVKESKVFYDTDPGDDRHLDEQVLADAGLTATEKVDLTSEDPLEVVHKGVRGLQSEFEHAEEEVEEAVSEVEAKAEHKLDDYVDAFSDAVDEGHEAAHAAFATAEAYSDADVDLTGEGHDGPVSHKGIRSIEKTLWEHEDNEII